MDTVDIRALRHDDPALIAETSGGAAWKPDRALWQQYLADVKEGRRFVLLALKGMHVLGYGTLAWVSDYQPFANIGIPEINNLVVAEQGRGRGLATRLIRHFEQSALAAGRSMIGIGVGLYADYGPAQRLYAKLGYRPDGLGITHRGVPVRPGATVSVDDDLILWLMKQL